MKKTHFSATGCYRIEVVGKVPPGWIDRLGGMQVLQASQNTTSTVTCMQGRVIDQAELSGILNSLYELHLPLLSVQFMEKQNEE